MAQTQDPGSDSQPRFAVAMLAKDRRSLAAKVLLTAGGLWLAVFVHDWTEGQIFSPGASLRLFGLLVALSLALWVPVHLWQKARR